MAIGGLFAAIGQALGSAAEEEGKRMDKSEKLFQELMQDRRLKLKEGAKFKPGMTTVQVRNLFEEAPDKSFASNQLASQALIDFWAARIPELKGIQAGTMTVGELNSIARGRGQDVGLTKSAQNLAMRESSFEEAKLKTRSQLALKFLDQAQKNPKKFNQFRQDYKNIMDYVNGKVDQLEIGDVEKHAELKKRYPEIYESIANFMQAIPGLGGFGTRPGIKTSAAEISDEELIESIKAIGDAKTAIKALQPLYPEIDIEKFIRENKDAFVQPAQPAGRSASKLAPMGLTGTPGAQQQLGQELQRPMQLQRGVGQPGIGQQTSLQGTAPTAENDLVNMIRNNPYYQKKKAMFTRNQMANQPNRIV